MAFDAGAIIGHVNLKTGDFTLNADKVVKKSGSMTGSMFKAQISFAAFKKVINFVGRELKDTVDRFNESDRVMKQTEAVLKSTGYAAGLTAKEVTNLATSLKNQTTFDDEAIQSAENLLLTFTKIGKDVFPDATEIVLDMSQALGQDLKSSSIQVGKALQDPILGVTALRRVGVNFSEQQQDVIKSLVNTGRSAEAQAMILKELQTEFGGSAKAARNTFGGALTALDNKIGDVKESVGAYVAAAGRPFVESLIEQAGAVEDWLKSAQGIEVISDIVGGVAAAFETIKQIVQPIVDAVWPELVKIGKQIEESFAQIFGKGQEAAGIFTVLSALSKGLALALTIVAKVIQFTIQTTGNLIDAFKQTGIVIGAAVDALAHLGDKTYADKLSAAAESAGKAWEKFVVDQVNGVKDIVETGVNGVKDIFENSEVDGKKMAENATATFNRVKGGIVSTMTSARDEAKKTYQQMMTDPKELTDAEKEWAEVRKTISETETETKIRHIREQGEAYVVAGANAVEVAQWVAKETEKITGDSAKKQKEKIQEVQAEYGKWSGVVSSVWSSVQAIWNQALQNEAVAVDNDYKKKKANIEATVTDENKKNKQLEALEKEYNDKKAEVAKKQFYAQQAAAVANVIFSTGQAIMMAFAQFGFPWGLIPAGIVTALGAVQIGTILSEQPPEFARGTPGVSRDQWGIVGERGRELAFLPRNTQIFTSEQTERMLAGGGGAQANVNFYGDINNDVDVDRAAAMMAAKVDAALRGAA